MKTDLIWLWINRKTDPSWWCRKSCPEGICGQIRLKVPENMVCSFLFFSVVEFAGELIKSTGECDRVPKKEGCSYPDEPSHLLMTSTCDYIKSNLNIGTSLSVLALCWNGFARAMRQPEKKRESPYNRRYDAMLLPCSFHPAFLLSCLKKPK